MMFEEKEAQVGDKMIIMDSLGTVYDWGEVSEVKGSYAYVNGKKFWGTSVNTKFRMMKNMSMMMMTVEDAASYIPMFLYEEAMKCPYLKEKLEKKMEEEIERKRQVLMRSKMLLDMEKPKKKKGKKKKEKSKEEKFSEAEKMIGEAFKKLQEEETVNGKEDNTSIQ